VLPQAYLDNIPEEFRHGMAAHFDIHLDMAGMEFHNLYEARGCIL
jgi:hypothetical protein